MISVALAASLVLAAAPIEQLPLSAKWLMRCAPSAVTERPTFAPAELDAILAGQAPAPTGWEVVSLPVLRTDATCWFVARVPASQTERGVWFGSLSAATTVWLDGSLVWRKGREAGPFWRSDQGFGGFILAAPLLAEGVDRVMVVRAFAPAGVALRPPVLVDPFFFPELHGEVENVSARALGIVMWFLFTISAAGLLFFAFRRDLRIFYFSTGTLGFALLFSALTHDFLAVDHNVFTRLSMVGTVIAYPFYALFFQHLYGIHRRPLFDRLGLGLLGAVTAAALLLPDAHVLKVVWVGAPIYFSAVVYAVYLNFRARREGHEIARSVLWGFGLYFFTIVIDGSKYFGGGGGNELENPVFQFGVMAFVASILVAITRRFLRLSVESSTMLAQLQGAAKELGGLVTTLQAAASQLTSAAAEQVTALTETASTTTEMNQTSALSATRAAELIHQGEAVAGVVKDGMAAAETSQAAILEISSSLGTVSAASTELAERVQRIDRIIDTVSFLADQSAALAINASIEASRAGEAGQGFAAVAREVRSLANDSRRATAEVREVLDEIRKRTLQVERHVSQGGSVVQGGVSHVARVAEVVETLGGTIQNAVGLMRQVEASARQHQAGVEQVLQAVTNIQRASESIRDGAETLSSLSRRASDLSAGLVSSARGGQ